MAYPLVFLLKSGRDYEVRYFRIDARQSNAPTANFMIKITLSKRTDTKTHFDQDIYHRAHYLPKISHDLREASAETEFNKKLKRACTGNLH